jgi:hypothetical protein
MRGLASEAPRAGLAGADGLAGEDAAGGFPGGRARLAGLAGGLATEAGEATGGR